MLPYNPERPWLKAVLIPFWILQDFICVVMIGLSIWTLVDYYDFEEGYRDIVLVKYVTRTRQVYWRRWTDGCI